MERLLSPIGIRALAVVVLVGLLSMGSRAAADAVTDRIAASPHRVELADPEADLKALRTLGIDVEGVFGDWARIYVARKEIDKLTRLGFVLTPLPDEGRLGVIRLDDEGVARGVARGEVPTQYHDYTTLTQDMQTVAANHPAITRLSSAGQSTEGRELWIMKITANPDVEEDEPELVYIAAMHGDEVVGKELCFNLINYLTDGYGNDPRVTGLVDSAEIWILPSMNPDGTASGSRYNAGGVDLNRSFPDWFADPASTPDGRQPETRAIMEWTEAHSPILSANFHGGVLVANYPFDNNETGSSVFSPTPEPDQPTFHSISLTYAENNPPMYASTQFEDGVTNGAEWYAISGGMQDWNYCWYGDFQVTMEVSESDWPPASQLPQFWEENLESMLSYFERASEGVRGVVTDAATGAPVAATVLIDDNPFASFADPDVGDYHRIVLPGLHALTVSAVGYESATFPISILVGPAARYDVALQPLPTDLQPVASHVDDGPLGNGWIDPGEEVDLSVTLQNLGHVATGVGATLVPTGWFTEVLVAAASYPDIPTGSHVESNPPGFRVRVDGQVPPGYTPGFAIVWSATEGSGTSEPFFLEVGEPTCGTTVAIDVPLPILDNKTTTSTIPIFSAERISEVRVPVDISHTYIGDLTVELVSPSGTHVLLHNRTGGSTADIVGTYGDDLLSAEPLSVLEGEPAGGSWKLSITDHAGGDQGTLSGWSVEVCGHPIEASTPEMRLRDLEATAQGVRLRWWPYPGVQTYRIYRSSDPSVSAAFLDVTAEDGDDTDTEFLDTSTEPLSYYLVTGVGAGGEGPLGHFDQ